MSVSSVLDRTVSHERVDEAAAALWLLDAPGMGPRRVLDLLGKYPSAQAAVAAARKGTTGTSSLLEHLQTTSFDEYRLVLESTLALGGDFKLWSDSDYPANLALWAGRPPVLFFKGDLSSLARRSLALVGRVDPTDSGLSEAARFARKCVEHNITVVSGLAKGIDGASHREALRPPAGTTHAVIGHGLDFAYPAENHDLYEAIPRHGSIISQFPTGVGPQRWTFPARNEVMCTLALGTVIIEGKEGCGSIIQADFSFKHGRPVFLLSRNLRMPNADWAKALVHRGAHVIERFEQVVEIVEETMRETEPDEGPEALFNLEAASDRREASSAVLFDLDGVVVDTRDATAAALADIAQRVTGRSFDPSVIDPTGSPQGALSRLGVPNAKDVYRREYDEALRRSRELMRTFEAVVQGIDALRAEGVRVAAVTAQPRRRIELIVPRDVLARFEEVLTYNETRGDKSAGIRRLLTEFGVGASRTLFIGDQPKDIEVARKAGVLSAGVLWGYGSRSDLERWSPDLMLTSPSDIGVGLLSNFG